MLSLVLSLGVGDTLRWRWGVVSCFWEPRPGLLPHFGSQIVPDLWLGFRRTKRFTCHEWKEERHGVRKGLLEERLLSLLSAFAFIYWNVPNLKRKIEYWEWCPHETDFFFFNAGLHEQRSWTSQESRWGVWKSHVMHAWRLYQKYFLRVAVFLLNPYGTGCKPCHLLGCPRSMFINFHHLLH